MQPCCRHTIIRRKLNSPGQPFPAIHVCTYSLHLYYSKSKEITVAAKDQPFSNNKQSGTGAASIQAFIRTILVITAYSSFYINQSITNRMKKFIPLILLLFVAAAPAGFAAVIKIQVSNFQFTPKTVNAKVGDTIVWMWKNGGHTTTSLGIPAGAIAWDAPMNSTHKRFSYRVTKTGVYNYDCTIHAPNMKGKINVSAALTAGLQDFSVSTDNGKPLLVWITTLPANGAYFSVQRSTDGDQFAEITKVNAGAAGRYSYTDNAGLHDKFVYYQVEMTDAKGNRQLSPVQLFTNTAAAAKLITSISPNPISNAGHLMLQFNADKEGSMLVKLFNQNGTLIKQANMSAVKGLNNGHFHIGSLSPGSYYIVCTLGGITEKHTVIVK